MSRDQIVSDALKKISDGQAQVLADAIGAAVDQSALEQKASDGTLSQADVDAAVAAAVAPKDQQIAALQAQDAADVKAGQDAVAAVNAQLTDVQTKLSDALAAKSADEAVIQGLQASAAKLKDLLDQLNAIVLPAQP